MSGLLDFLRGMGIAQAPMPPTQGGLLGAIQRQGILGPAYGNPLLMRQFAGQRNAQDEAKFQAWAQALPWFKEFVQQYGEQPDLNTKDYDYRAAWRAGVSPQRDPYDGNRFHWPSSLPGGQMLKSDDHPTAWKEHFMRLTGKNPDEVGATKQDFERMSAGR